VTISAHQSHDDGMSLLLVPTKRFSSVEFSPL